MPRAKTQEDTSSGETHMNVGFIGLGIMGSPMAGHLIDAGHTLFVYDVVCIPDELKAKGATASARCWKRGRLPPEAMKKGSKKRVPHRFARRLSSLWSRNATKIIKSRSGNRKCPLAVR